MTNFSKSASISERIITSAGKNTASANLGQEAHHWKFLKELVVRKESAPPSLKTEDES